MEVITDREWSLAKDIASQTSTDNKNNKVWENGCTFKIDGPKDAVNGLVRKGYLTRGPGGFSATPSGELLFRGCICPA